MSDWLLDFMIKLGIGLLITGMLSILVFSAIWRKRTSSSFKKLTKIGSKIGNNVAKSGKDRYIKLTSKKPVLNNNQLPGGIRRSNYSQPATITPQKIPKQEKVIPIPEDIDPTYGIGNLVFKYFDGCRGYTLFDTGPNNESLAFECVAGYDEKTGKYMVWFYKVKYHRDERTKKKHNDYGQFERAY